MLSVCFISGGVDSVGTLFLLLEKGKIPDYILYTDTTIEYPETLGYVEDLNDFLYRKFKREIEILEPADNFEFYLKKIKKKNGYNGYGVPTRKALWCRRYLKIKPSNDFFDYFGINEAVLYFGFLGYEKHRFEKTKKQYARFNKNFIIEAPAVKENLNKANLKKLIEKEFYINPIYEFYNRCSCFCCPLAGKSHFISLLKHHPKLFKKAKKWENYSIRHHNKTFLEEISLKELEKLIQ